MNNNTTNDRSTIYKTIVGIIAIFLAVLSVFAGDNVILAIVLVALAGISVYFEMLANFPDKKLLSFLLASATCALLLGIRVYAQKPNDSTIPSGAIRGSLYIDFREILLSYADEQGTSAITVITEENLIEETIQFESTTYNVQLEDYKIENNVLIFNDIPSGRYALNIKLKNYDLVSENIVLQEKALQENIWKKTITLQPETDQKNFTINVQDETGMPLTEDFCDLAVKNTDESIEGMLIGANGDLPYTFSYSGNEHLLIYLHHEGKRYIQEIEPSSASGTINAKFQGVLSKETLAQQKTLEEKKKIINQERHAEEYEMQNNPQLLLKNTKEVNTNLTKDGQVVRKFKNNLSEENEIISEPITIEQDGPYWIEFRHANLTEDQESWRITVTGKNDECYLEFTSNKNHENTISCITGLPAGDYYINVERNYWLCDSVYELYLMTYETPNYEHEFNDEILNALYMNDLKDNQTRTYLGNLAHSDDIDYFSFEIEHPSVVSLKFEHENYTEDRDGWGIYIKNSNSEVMNNMTSNWKQTNVLMDNIGLASGTYYIEVSRNGSFHNGVYALSIVKHITDSWEEEFNDTVSSANSIVAGLSKNGGIYSSDDVDYYKFVCETTKNYEIKFRHENLTVDQDGWVINVLDKNSESLWEEYMISRLNDTEIVKDVSLKKGEIYYIQISGYNACLGADYKISVTED